MNNRQVKATIKLINETRRVLNRYGWLRDDRCYSGQAAWGGTYEDGFTLEGAVEAAARIRNVNPNNLHALLDLEVWNRTSGRYGYAFLYNSAPSRRKGDILKLLDKVEAVLHQTSN